MAKKWTTFGHKCGLSSFRRKWMKRRLQCKCVYFQESNTNTVENGFTGLAVRNSSPPYQGHLHVGNARVTPPSPRKKRAFVSLVVNKRTDQLFEHHSSNLGWKKGSRRCSSQWRRPGFWLFGWRHRQQEQRPRRRHLPERSRRAGQQRRGQELLGWHQRRWG